MKLKKYLPLILLGVGIILLIGVFAFVRGKRTGGEAGGDNETALLDVELRDRPVVSLIPTDDGHYLTLKVDKINIKADSVDYLLLYDTEAGIQQGVPGTVKLEGLKNFEEKLLLGSESAGKFRYDDGVSTGSVTLSFRNDKGQLLVKFMSDFHMQKGTGPLSTIDESFKYELDDSSENFFVSMHTVGYPGDAKLNINKGPFGVFSSSNDKFSGKVEMEGADLFRWDGGNWQKINENSTENIGFFYSS